MNTQDFNIPSPEMIKVLRTGQIVQSLKDKGVFENLDKRILDGLSDRDSTNLKFPKLNNAESKYLVDLFKNHGYRVNLSMDFEDDCTTITISLS